MPACFVSSSFGNRHSSHPECTDDVATTELIPRQRALRVVPQKTLPASAPGSIGRSLWRRCRKRFPQAGAQKTISSAAAASMAPVWSALPLPSAQRHLLPSFNGNLSVPAAGRILKALFVPTAHAPTDVNFFISRTFFSRLPTAQMTPLSVVRSFCLPPPPHLRGAIGFRFLRTVPAAMFSGKFLFILALFCVIV